ncbi:hypothetical protein E4U10_002116 [Claviceps purpurea]|nr:hypothetical protein E4U10_002116 [Claviceps purpurea]
MNQQNGGNALGEHLLELFLQGQERDRKLQQERDQQQQTREIDQQALQCSHQIGQQAKEKEQDAMQQTQERAMTPANNDDQHEASENNPPDAFVDSDRDVEMAA